MKRETDRIRREHAAIAASYEAQNNTISGVGLPHGPCQCAVCSEQKMSNTKSTGDAPEREPVLKEIARQ